MIWTREKVIEAVEAGESLSGAYLRDVNLSDVCLFGADLRDANLRGASLRNANLRGANLSRANLRYADLSNANLSGANLSSANLRFARLGDLSNANLSGANLSSANLRFARLGGADLSGAKLPPAPVVSDLHQRIATSVGDGSGLDMENWHTSCGTTHCRGGWAIFHAGEAGAELERSHGPSVAATLIFNASTGMVPNFHEDDETALEDIRKCAEEASS